MNPVVTPSLVPMRSGTSGTTNFETGQAVKFVVLLHRPDDHSNNDTAVTNPGSSSHHRPPVRELEKKISAERKASLRSLAVRPPPRWGINE